MVSAAALVTVGPDLRLVRGHSRVRQDHRGEKLGMPARDGHGHIAPHREPNDHSLGNAQGVQKRGNQVCTAINGEAALVGCGVAELGQIDCDDAKPSPAE
jgi:hypothetical protein